MQKSEAIDKLAAALCKFQGEVGTVKMTGFNPHFKSKFATPHDISDAIKAPLAANGLAVTQMVSMSQEFGSVLTTLLTHSSGQWLSGSQPLMVDKPTPQGMGSALTYARRYGISAMLNLIVDTDDDGNSVSLPKQTQQSAPEQSNYSMAPGFVKKTIMTGPELSEWVMNYGTPQVKGKKLKSCTKEALLGFIDWAKKTQSSTGKPLAEGVHSAVMNIHAYFDYLKTKPEPNVAAMVSGDVPPPPSDKDNYTDPNDPMNNIPF